MASPRPRPSPAPDRPVVPAVAATNAGALPLDAVYEILLRLPAKVLFRLRTVCRPWRSLLSDPQFAAAYAVRHPGPLLIATNHVSLVEIMDLSGRNVKKVRRNEGDWVRCIGPDLVCVKNTRSGICQMLNPATGAVYYLPQNLLEEHAATGLKLSDYGEPSYVFGHVARTGQYKVLRMFLDLKGDSFSDNLFEVCRINNGNHARWKGKQAPSLSFMWIESTRVVVDGVVYFLSEAVFDFVVYHEHEVTEQEWIVPFDLDTEEWRPNIKGPSRFVDDSFNMPNNHDDPNSMQLTLANLNGSLVICLGTNRYVDLWFLMDIEKGMWVKQHSLQVEQNGLSLFKVPLLLLDDRRVVKLVGNRIQIHDSRTNTSKNMLTLWDFSGISIYTGNLLSLDGQN
ncbi:hypothetical protein ACP4OV_024480 [Aristida adscensionis]